MEVLRATPCHLGGDFTRYIIWEVPNIIEFSPTSPHWRTEQSGTDWSADGLQVCRKQVTAETKRHV